jgi:protocatechuate 3,4-dioxygenase beta subunit
MTNSPIDFTRRRTLRALGSGAGLTLLALNESIVAHAATTVSSRQTWLTNGTKALKDTLFANPFLNAGAACSLTCELIEGPCWTPNAPRRQDISAGELGIPMRVMLRLVQSDQCSPLANAEIEIWHTHRDGVYSGKEAAMSRFCSNNNPQAMNANYFRGRAITNSEGLAVFDSCFPGWYSGRPVHIHLLVRKPDHAGEQTTLHSVATTQLFFPEELTKAIFTSADGYKQHGQPDTYFANDNVLSGVTDVTAYVFDVMRMPNGSLLASKTIAISDSQRCGSRGFPRRRQ